MSNSQSLQTRNNQQVPEWLVQVYVYDLSKGMARMLSQSFLGKQIDGIWHTGIVVHEYEYFFGGGIAYGRPGQTSAGAPLERITLGYTRKTQAELHAHLIEISPRFTQSTYRLLSHNCNNFSNELALWLCGKPIPAHIVNLPADAFSTPQGLAFKPMVEAMEQSIRQQGAAGAPVAMPWAESALLLPPLNTSPTSLAGDRQRSQAEIDAELAQHHSVPLPAVTLNAQGTARVHTATDRDPAGEFSAHAPATEAAVTQSHLLLTEASCVPLRSTDAKQASSFLVLIRQSSKKQAASEHQLTDAELASLETAVTRLQQTSDTGLEYSICNAALDRALLNWSNDSLFPILGLMRLTVLNPETALHYATSEACTVRERLLSLCVASERAAVCSMSLCTLANLIAQPRFVAKVSAVAKPLMLACVARCTSLLDPSLEPQPAQSVRLMAAQLLYNVIATFPEIDDASDDAQHEAFLGLLGQLFDALSSERESDPLVIERLLHTLAQLCRRSAIIALLLDSTHDWPALQKSMHDRLAAHPQTQTTIAQLCVALSFLLQQQASN